MKPASFHYHLARSLPDALATLAEIAPEDGRILAGGQSLLPAMALRMARPQHLLDINKIPEMDEIIVDGNSLIIKACVRHSAFHTNVTSTPFGKFLTYVASHIAHFPIRTRGTFCGSLAMADPASEWCCLSATLEAEIIAKSLRGTRSIRARDFFEGFMATSLSADELVAEVRLPLLPVDTRYGFVEFSRRPGDYALVMALVSFRILDGQIMEPRVGIGGAEGRPRRIREAEEALLHMPPETRVFKLAADAATDSITPMVDSNIGADFRKDLVRALSFRALRQASM